MVKKVAATGHLGTMPLERSFSMRIAICDDELICIERLQKLIKAYFKTDPGAVECFTFTDPQELLASDFSKYDILFLDVDMGEKNGIEVAQAIRKKNNTLVLIYVSSFVEYAPRGYEVQAFRYLLKQDLETTLKDCLEAALQKVQQRQRVLNVTSEAELYQFLLDNILYIESCKRIVTLHLADSEQSTFSYYEKLQTLENELASKDFFRIQKSYLVNAQHILNIKNYIVSLDNGESLRASAQGYQELVQKFLKWKGRF